MRDGARRKCVAQATVSDLPAGEAPCAALDAGLASPGPGRRGLQQHAHAETERRLKWVFWLPRQMCWIWL